MCLLLLSSATIKCFNSLGLKFGRNAFKSYFVCGVHACAHMCEVHVCVMHACVCRANAQIHVSRAEDRLWWPPVSLYALLRIFH